MKRLIIATIFALVLVVGGKAHAQAWHGFKSCAAFSNTNSFTAPGTGGTWQPWYESPATSPTVCLDTSGHAYVFAKRVSGTGTEYRWMDTHGVYGSDGTLGYYPTFTSCGPFPYDTAFTVNGTSYQPYSSLTNVAPTYCVADYGTIWMMAKQVGTSTYKWVMTDDNFAIGN